MPSYKYKVIFEDGKIGNGKIMALNKSHAMDSLKRDNIQPLSITKLPDKNKAKQKRLDRSKIKDSTSPKKVSVNDGEKPKIKITTLKELSQIGMHPFSKVTRKDVLIFINNLYILKKAKFNNIQALRLIKGYIENNFFKDVVEDIILGVESGEKMNVVMND